MAENPWFYVTLIGQPEVWYFLTAGLIVLYLVLRHAFRVDKNRMLWFRTFVLVLTLSFLIGFGIVQGLKLGLQVPRLCVTCPAEGCNPYCPDDYSFPSGHATVGFIVFTSLFFVLRKPKYLPVFIVPLLVSYSRVALGVHTWADAMAGSVIGFLVPILVFKIGQKRLFLTEKGRPKSI